MFLQSHTCQSNRYFGKRKKPLHLLLIPDGKGCGSVVGPSTISRPSFKIFIRSINITRSSPVAVVLPWYTQNISLPSGDQVILLCPVPVTIPPLSTFLASTGLSGDFSNGPNGPFPVA